MFIINLVKKLFVFISGLLAYLSLPLIAFAVVTPTPASVDPCTDSLGNPITVLTGGVVGTLCSFSSANIGNTVRQIVIFFIVIAFVIALFYLLFGGIKWITSRGDKTEVEAARNHIMAAIIGLVVVFLAIFILFIILTFFGINSADLRIPNISGTSTSTTNPFGNTCPGGCAFNEQNAKNACIATKTGTALQACYDEATQARANCLAGC